MGVRLVSTLSVLPRLGKVEKKDGECHEFPVWELVCIRRELASIPHSLR